MTKRVFSSHSQLAHVWAQQTQPGGRASDNRMFFDGKTIFSYGRHWPIAHFITPDLVLVNSDGKSVSTLWMRRGMSGQAAIRCRLMR